MRAASIGIVIGDWCRWVVRFGHQVTAKNPYRARRHIPNPNVSVKSLQSAATKWVLGWDNEDDDDDAEEDYESARGSHDHDEMTLHLSAADGGSHMRGAGSDMMGGPLSVLPEEEGQGSVSPSGNSPNDPGMNAYE